MKDVLYEILSTRRSVRRFRPEPPPRAVVERILAAAVTAPSASNKQPWRFLVVVRRETIDRMAAAVRRATLRVAAVIPPASEPAFRAYGDYFTRFESAPLVIVPIFRSLAVLSNLAGEDLAAADRQAILAMERDSSLASTALAMQNLLLAAHAEGLGASGMTGPLVAAPELREILDVPETWEILAFVPVGHPDEEPAPTTRRPAEKVTRWLD